MLMTEPVDKFAKLRIYPTPPKDKSNLTELRPGVWANADKKIYFYECQDCKEVDPMIFMVHKEVWEPVGITGLICIHCFEQRLGRKLRIMDLKPSYIMSDAIRYYEWIKELS